MGTISRNYELKVTCDRSYLAGFPLIVGVEVRNVSSNIWDTLPFFDLFTVPGPVSFVLVGHGHEWTWDEKIPMDDDGTQGIQFEPGKSWLALQDLSEMHPDVPPGSYELSASVVFSGELIRSKPEHFQIQPSAEADRAIAGRLRATSDDEKTGWHSFVRHNLSTPETSGLSAAALKGLAYYLYLHRAAYGPQAIAALDPQGPRAFAHGVLESEAAILRLEILTAAGRPEVEGLEKAILERWPGLGWRTERIRSGQGLLTSLRSIYGVDSIYAPKDKPRPYQQSK